MPDPFTIRLSTEAAEDLVRLRQFDRKTIRDEIERHLVHEPTRTSRSRIKRLTQPFWAQFRLRVNAFRVYYDVEVDNRTVLISRVIAKGTALTPMDPP